MKNVVVCFALALLLFSVSFVAASGEHEDIFEKAEEIIKQKISCDELNEEDLEILGDYYMEQMHPGELHEIMDERMGGEGSASLRQAHINIGRAFYCGEHGAMSGGMMNAMMGRGMMGAGGMGVMGNSYYGNAISGFGLLNFIFTILILVILILLIVWLVRQIQNNTKNKRK